MTHRLKITNGAANALQPKVEMYVVWDTELTGFGVRVNPNGRKTFFYKYNLPGNETRRITIGKHGSLTADAARQIAKEHVKKVASGGDPATAKAEYRDSMTLQELWDLYFERHVKPRKKPATVKSDDYLAKKHILPILGSRRLASITKPNILALHHDLVQSPYQANRVVSLLRHMFNMAEQWEIVPQGFNPCLKIMKYKEKSRERFLSAEEVKSLWDTLDEIEREQSEHQSVINAIRLLLLTGCRMGEVLTLKWEYVDMKRQCFNLPDSKTGKKTVPVGRAVIDVLTRITRRNDNPYVIYGPRCGEYFRDIQRQWRTIRDRAGLPDLRIHDLRHTYASFAVSRGYSLPMIGKILGHKDTATTQRYAHLAFNPVVQLADDVAGMIAGVVHN